jgi:predicted aspartyl protease
MGSLLFTSEQSDRIRDEVLKRSEQPASREIISATAIHTEVPIKLYRGYTVVVQGSIAGLRKCNLLIDTGAVPSVIDRRIANKLHLTGKSDSVSVFSRNLDAEQVVLPTVRLGLMHADQVPVLVHDLSFIEEHLGERVDAVVGLDVLAQNSFSIDYAAKKLIFGPVEPSDSQFAIQEGPGFVYTTLQVKGQSVRLMVDTGTSQLILFESSVRTRLTELRPLGTKTSSNMGGDLTLREVQLKELHLGSADFPRLDAFLLDDSGAEVPGLDGLLGIRSLGLTRVGFDFEKQMVYWR